MVPQGGDSLAENEVSIPIRWDRLSSVPQPSNYFVVQKTPADEIVLTFGHASPVLGSQTQARAQELASEGIAPEVVARVILSMKTAGELLQILDQIGIKNQ